MRRLLSAPATTLRLAPGTVMRPEEFGALLYSYRDRSLHFLKSPALVSLVELLDAGAPLDDAVGRMLDEADPARTRREAALRRGVDRLVELGVLV